MPAPLTECVPPDWVKVPEPLTPMVSCWVLKLLAAAELVGPVAARIAAQRHGTAGAHASARLLEVARPRIADIDGHGPAVPPLRT